MQIEKIKMPLVRSFTNTYDSLMDADVSPILTLRVLTVNPGKVKSVSFATPKI